MKQVEEYVLLHGTNATELTQRVGEALGDGWQPLGAPFCVPADDKSYTYVAQAMVQYKTKGGPEHIEEPNFDEEDYT